MRPKLTGSKTRRLCWRVALFAKRIGDKSGIQVSIQAVAPYERATMKRERRASGSTL